MGRHDPLLVPYAQGLGIPEPSVVVYGFTGRMGNLIDGSSQRCLGRVVRMRRFDKNSTVGSAAMADFDNRIR